MTTNATTVGFKLAQLQQEIIELENKYAVITEEDKQKFLSAALSSVECVN